MANVPNLDDLFDISVILSYLLRSTREKQTKTLCQISGPFNVSVAIKQRVMRFLNFQLCVTGCEH